jgi:GNAT superfamily N-acetyltransferase
MSSGRTDSGAFQNFRRDVILSPSAPTVRLAHAPRIGLRRFWLSEEAKTEEHGRAANGALFFFWRATVIDTQSRIVLRAAQAADAWDLAGLRFASLVEMGLSTPPERERFLPRAANELFELIGAERMAAWLLLADGIPSGCACVLFWNRLPYPSSSLHAEIAGVYVVPELRKQGYATELVSEAVASARARGVRKITLSPTEVGRSIYTKLGFKDETHMAIRS